MSSGEKEKILNMQGEVNYINEALYGTTGDMSEERQSKKKLIDNEIFN